jgi:hypothetical protein
MTRRPSHTLFARAFVIVSALAPGAMAQLASDDVARRALIREAQEASRRGDHLAAIERATRAAQLRATPSIQYFLAREHRSVGHVVEALAYAGECVSAATADVSLHNRAVVIEACREVEASVATRVARLSVRPPSPAPAGLRVQVNGAALADVLLGVEYPVTPGDVNIHAEAPGFVPFNRALSLAEGQTEAVAITFEPEAVAPPPPPPPPPPPARVEVTPPPTTVPPRTLEAPRGAGVGPWITAGAGALTLGAAGVVYGLALSARDDRDTAANGAQYDPIAETYNQRYRDLLVVTNVLIGVGAAALAGGVTWWIIARTRTNARALVTPGSLSLALRW